MVRSAWLDTDHRAALPLARVGLRFGISGGSADQTDLNIGLIEARAQAAVGGQAVGRPGQGGRCEAGCSTTPERTWYWPEPAATTSARLAAQARTDADFLQVAWLSSPAGDVDVAAIVAELVKGEAVPAALRYTADSRPAQAHASGWGDLGAPAAGGRRGRGVSTPSTPGPTSGGPRRGKPQGKLERARGTSSPGPDGEPTSLPVWLGRVGFHQLGPGRWRPPPGQARPGGMSEHPRRSWPGWRTRTVAEAV